MNYLSIIQLAVSLAPSIKSIIDTASTNEDIVTKVNKVSPTITSVLDIIGKEFFPEVPDSQKVVAVVNSAFDPDVTKWIQNSLNKLNTPTPSLVVDGIYGNATKEAVKVYQKNNNLVVDGWAGQLTQASIQQTLNKK